MDPMNYAGQLGQAQQLVPDLAFRDLQMRLGDLQTQRLATENQAAQAEMQRLSTAAQRQQQFSADAQEAFRGGPRAIAQLVARYPEFGDTVKGAWDRMDAGVRDADLRSATEIYSAASNGRYDIAAESLRRRIEADKAIDGQADPQDEAILAGLTSGDPEQQRDASARVGAMLAAITGPDKFASTFGALREGEAGFTLSPGSKRFDRDGKEIASAPFAPRTITVGEGQTVVEYDPNTGGGGPASGGGGAPGGAPRNVRNNNPGNIIDSEFARSQPGYVRSDGRFAVFETPEAGRAAQGALLGSYIDRGFNTVQKIINRWAPPSENDTGTYVRNVARELGVDPNAPLSKAAIPQLAAAITRVEGGPGGSSAGVPGATASGGRIIAQGAPKQGKTPAQRMTPAEVKAEGLDPNLVYYRGEDGVPKAVSGQSRNQVVNLNEGQAKATGYLNSAIAATNSLNSVRGYQPSEIAIGINSLAAGNPLKRNLSQVDRRVLNAQLAFATAVLRLESGAVVSDQEAAQKARVLFPMPGDGAEVQADKRAQREAAIRALRTAAGPGSARVPQAAAPGGGGQQAPVRVRSVQEAQKLPAGTTFIAPNGRTYRKK